MAVQLPSLKMNLDCRKCTDAQKKVRGCIKKTSSPAFNLDGENLYRCPLKLITRQSLEYVRFYNFYRDGYLPDDGGIMDQPGKFLDAVGIIENSIREMEKEIEKK